MFLKNNGFVVIARNFRCKNGEIDIIAKKDSLVIFVEVKARHSSDFGYSSEFVNRKKQQRIVGCAKYFLVKKKLKNIDVRFDVIGIENDSVDWIENAFLEDL